MKIKFLFIALICSFSIIAWSNPVEKKVKKGELITIPLDLSSKRPVLLVILNGKGPYKFIFDTGSSENVIDEDLAKSLGFRLDGQESASSTGSANILMSNNLNQVAVAIPETNISENVKMSTSSLRKYFSVDGILSPTYFSKYMVTIDYPNAQLILGTGDLLKEDSDVFSLAKGNGVVNFLIIINDIKLESHLNSGNPGWIDIPFSLKTKLGIKNEIFETGFSNNPVDSSRKWNGKLKGIIKIGNIKYDDPEIRLVEGVEFANIGFRFFNETKITIDNKNQLIKLEKVTPSVLNQNTETNDYTGLYGNIRILLANRKMSLQKGSAPIIDLMEIRTDFFKLISEKPESNDILNVLFERDASNSISGMTVFFKDGREEYLKKN